MLTGTITTWSQKQASFATRYVQPMLSEQSALTQLFPGNSNNTVYDTVLHNLI